MPFNFTSLIKSTLQQRIFIKPLCKRFPADFEMCGKLEDAKAFVEQFLADGPKLSKEFDEAYERNGFSRATILRARKELRIMTGKLKHAYQSPNYVFLPMHAEQFNAMNMGSSMFETQYTKQ